ncbi:MAG: Holliday junction DNA helicase RuvA [Nitrospirae bacterium RBG_19FT_COMBO_42_15]|nr:MAG: Holliday junction DNA helicase RuvA [Nitrospirae bacterium RBG_19FT_COMBO_42_15]
MRILGLDFGDKRIGVAVSDEMGWSAQAVKTINRRSAAEDVKQIKEIAEEYEADEIIVGLPVNMNGTLGPGAEKVNNFISLLKGHIAVPINTWDERLSTVAAERNLIDAGLSRKKRKDVIDMLAASVILQGYLDYLRSPLKEEA